MRTLNFIDRAFFLPGTNRQLLRFANLILFVLLGQVTSMAQTNIAFGKPARQSSTYSSGGGKSFPASLALDGVKEGFGMLSHTNQEAGAWWEVDLGGNYDISSIKVYNATDHPQRMNDFTILVSEVPFTGNTGGTVYVANQPAPNSTKSYSGNAKGRYVRLFLNGTNYLTIHEIEIFGTQAGSMASTTATASTTSRASTTGGTWSFYNDGRFPLDVSVDGNKVGRLEVSAKMQSLPVKVGDEVSVAVVDPGNLNTDNVGYPTVLINEKTENPLRITPRAAYFVKDARTGLNYDYQVSLHGIDLTNFNPIDVAGSFKSNGQIFDGLRDGTYEYKQLGDGTYIPKGFMNTGNTNSGGGNFNKKTIIGKDKMKEAWAIGATASVPIPVPQKPGTTVTPTLGFKYGESMVENSSDSDVFISNSQRKVIYNLELVEPKDAVLTKDFTRAVEGIRSLADASQVVERFGTHYTNNVFYGGQYFSLIRIHEDTYYKANTQNVDLSLGIEVDEEGIETTAKTIRPSGGGSNEATQKTGSTNPSSKGSGKLNFEWEKTRSHEEVYGNIENEYWYVGGIGNSSNWSADKSNALAVRVGELFYISDLVKPEIFKTAMNEADLAPKRALLKQAIDLKLQNMTYLKKPAAYRAFHYRIKSIEYVHYNDDANTRIKGNITAHILSDGQEIGTEVLWERKDWSEENKGGLIDRQGLKLPPNRWVKGKQDGTYVGTGIDLTTMFKPLQIKFTGSITDKDDCCFDTGDDVLNMVGNPVMTLKDSNDKQEFSFELDHFFTHVEKMRLKVTIEVAPLIGF